MKYRFLFLTLIIAQLSLTAQSDRWQLRADYLMDIDFNVKKHQFKGEQTIKLSNNSPDTLDKLFYHLYFNAFQPNSMMDVRSRTIDDPDRRVGDRIVHLKEDEYGYQKIKSLKCNGVKTQYHVEGTILEVRLENPIPPGGTAKLVMKFDAQVPAQIRRSGRDSKEGIDYSMTQWYPKLCNYDVDGWHPNPYVGREFYGIWGNFAVNITIDKKYILGGSGLIQNPEQVGYGYQSGDKEPKKRGKKLTWKFLAENVHDFAWAADRDYKHTTYTCYDGTIMHYLYQPGEATNENWENLPKAMDAALKFINEHYGQYPYPVYSFIQGGDGGMEYPMATLITGERTYGSLVGVSVHELMHSWYQMVLGTNEAIYPWMDEGFTSYGSSEVMNHLKSKKLIPGDPVDDPNLQTVRGFCNFTTTGREEALSTHADHYITNQAYGVASYVKGAVALKQLEYLMGKDVFDGAMLAYYDEWKFKHPTDRDFFRVMEKESDLVLDWFRDYWVNTTHTIDYAMDTVYVNNENTNVRLRRVGKMPMPIDVTVYAKDGRKFLFNIPLRMMRGNKSEFNDAKVLADWPWTHPTYEFKVGMTLDKIDRIEIDPSRRMADVDLANNMFPKLEAEEEKEVE